MITNKMQYDGDATWYWPHCWSHTTATSGRSGLVQRAVSSENNGTFPKRTYDFECQKGVKSLSTYIEVKEFLVQVCNHSKKSACVITSDVIETFRIEKPPCCCLCRSYGEHKGHLGDNFLHRVRFTVVSTFCIPQSTGDCVCEHSGFPIPERNPRRHFKVVYPGKQQQPPTAYKQPRD